MIKFDKPQNLNGTELRIELADAGIQLLGSIEGTPDFYVVDNDLFLNISENQKNAASIVVAAHNGTTVAPEPTIADKLASVGLSLDELKAAILGGN